MLRLFELHSDEARSQRREAYRRYLARRDGALDFVHGTLGRREDQLAELRLVDADGTAGALSLSGRPALGFDRRRSYSGPVLLALSLARVHGAFGFGGPDAYRRAVERALRDGDDTEALVAAEQRYGARLLATSSTLVGPASRAEDGELRRGAGPALLAGALAAGRWPGSLLLAAQTVHAVALLNLLRVSDEVLRSTPSTRDRIQAHLLEVLTDAVGHVSYRRLGLDAAGLERAQRALPVAALAHGSRCPEMAALGASVFPSATTMRYRLEHRLPAEVRASAFIA